MRAPTLMARAATRSFSTLSACAVPVEIRYLAILFLKRQFARDVRHAGRKHRQMKLWHGPISPDEGNKNTAPLTDASSQNPPDSASQRAPLPCFSCGSH